MKSLYIGLRVLCFPIPLFYIFCLTSKLIFWEDFLCSQEFLISKIPELAWAAYTRIWLIKRLALEKSVQRFIDINKEYDMQMILSSSQVSF